MTTPPLTRRQQAVYDHLISYHEDFDQAPTLDELCEALGVRSRGSLHKHVQALVDAGLVEPMNGKQRGVRLRQPPPRKPLQLPLLGYIAAGLPIEAIETKEHIEIPSHFQTGRPCYALAVKGESMVDDGILDGDWVIVERTDQARNGQIVVALIDGFEATLKRILQRPDEVLLCPANSAMAPISFHPDRVQIQGVVIGQMRTYR
jgi:repressor LexA